MDRTTGELLRTATRHSAGRCAALCLASVAATGAGLLLPAALGRTLDLLIAHAPATRWVLYCAALVALLTLLDALETVLAGTLDARTAAFLRRRVTRHILAVGPRAADRFGAGDLVARVVGNAAQAGTAPGARAALLAALAGPVGAVVALALVDPWLAAVFLAGAPVLTLLLRTLARDTSVCVADYQREQGRIAAALTEAVAGARTISAAGTADRDTARILRPLPALSRAGLRMWRVQGRAAAQAVAVAPLLHLGVVAVAGVLLTRHRLSAGDVLAASRYAVLATGVGVLVGQLSGLVRSRTAAARLGEVLDQPAPATATGVCRWTARAGWSFAGSPPGAAGAPCWTASTWSCPAGGRWPWWAARAPGSRCWPRWPADSPIRTPGKCCWTAYRCPRSPGTNCARRSPRPSTAPRCWARPSRPRSRSGRRAVPPPPPGSGKPPAPPAPTISSAVCPRATPPAAPTPRTPAARPNVSAWPARSPRRPRCSFSTTPSPASTR